MGQGYALVFRGHGAAYEVQATAKLFLPGVRFQLCPDGVEAAAEHRILTESRQDGTAICQTVDITLHGKQLRRSQELPAGASGAEQEFALCRLLYESLRELTGYTPPWGMLTGIRPVRLVQQALDAGQTPEAAMQELAAHYSISEEKSRLALKTALVQRPFLAHAPEEIGLYIAIPFCPTRCSYCSFVSHSVETAGKLITAYLEKLCEELRILGEIIRHAGLRVQTVYLGGGTPTVLTAEQLTALLQCLRACIAFEDVREFTAEAGRPDTITAEKLAALKANGVTRISVNPQTMQDSVLAAIGRRHSAEDVREAFRLARAAGFDDINMDLIAGLPTDTVEGFAETLREVMALAPESITVHTLTVKRAAALYRDSTAFAEAEAAVQMTAFAAEALQEAGWQPYYLYRQKNTLGNLENVGYARPGKESLYNILIMDETQTILGAGCGASTKLVGTDITRIMNYKYPYEYMERFGKLMEKKQEIVRFYAEK